MSNTVKLIPMGNLHWDRMSSIVNRASLAEGLKQLSVHEKHSTIMLSRILQQSGLVFNLPEEFNAKQVAIASQPLTMEDSLIRTIATPPSCNHLFEIIKLDNSLEDNTYIVSINSEGLRILKQRREWFLMKLTDKLLGAEMPIDDLASVLGRTIKTVANLKYSIIKDN